MVIRESGKYMFNALINDVDVDVKKIERELSEFSRQIIFKNRLNRTQLKKTKRTNIHSFIQ